jgi:hypothetical protein
MNNNIIELPNTPRQDQIDKIIQSLNVLMSANPDYDLMDILQMVSLKAHVPSLYLLTDSHIEETIDFIFDETNEKIEYIQAVHPDDTN